MNRKEPRWVVAFLRALERTGKARAAALDAGVDFSTAYARRRAHGDFAAAWAEALQRFEAAKDRARKAELAETVERVRKGRLLHRLWRAFAGKDRGEEGAGTAPSPSPSGEAGGAGNEDAEEMVIRPSRNGAPKLVKASAGRWSRKREEIFLAELGASANVRRASAAAGLSRNAFMARRRKDPHFAAAWDAVVEMARVDARSFLAEAMTRTFDPLALPDPESSPMPKVSIAETIRIAEMKGPAGGDQTAGIVPYDVGEVRKRLEQKMRLLGLRDEDEGEGEEGEDEPPRAGGVSRGQGRPEAGREAGQ